MEIVLNLGAPFRRQRADGTSELQPHRMIVGQLDRSVTIAPTGRVDLVGVRFHPTGAHPMLGFSMAELRNELVALEDVVALEAHFDSEPTIFERARTLDRSLGSRFPEPAAADPDLERAVGHIVAVEGRVSVDALAFQMAVSVRQMERRFLARVGLAPKRFIRILRFQGALRTASDDARAWAEVALDCGYFDQAHFIRDFKRFTGTSPARFFSRESELTRFFTRGGRTSVSYNTSSLRAP